MSTQANFTRLLGSQLEWLRLQGGELYDNIMFIKANMDTNSVFHHGSEGTNDKISGGQNQVVLVTLWAALGLNKQFHRMWFATL
jgi:hypothetical protein